MARDVELDDIEVFDDNTWRVSLRLEPGIYVSVDFGPDDDETGRMFTLLSEIASGRLHDLGERGVAIRSFTPPEEGE